CQQYNIDPYSF
nr:immunoglobulin light chain junction region [Macaca mulatta]MOW42342.1 immunoglobulin light chain junction region [Macaca mulatta]